MAIRKYMFVISYNGIKTYDAKDDKQYELLRPRGEESFPYGNMKEFFEWFDRVAAIAKDDLIDFCFLSEIPEIQIEAQIEAVSSKLGKGISSWSKDEVIRFCENNLKTENFEIVTDKDVRFTIQRTNMYNKESIKNLYLKCIPEFSMTDEDNEGQELGGETNVLYQYFKNALSRI